MRNLAAALSLASAVFCFTAISQAQPVRTHHVRDAVRNGQAQQNGRLPASQVLNLDIVLPLRDPAGLDSFLADLYDPSSPNFHHYLTPTEFTAKFGPSQADYDAVVSYAKAKGLTVTGGSRDGMDVQVSGRVFAIEGALHITLHTYKHPNENRNFYGPDSEPTPDLPFPLWHISGLDNYSIPHPLLVNKNDYAAANGISPDAVVSHATTGSGPSASFLGSDMRAAYYGGTALTGAGQTVGLLEYYGTDLADLDTYYTNVHQTNTVPVTLVSTDGTSTSCLHSAGCDDGEQNLDITQALGMAPGLTELVMFVGSTDTAMISAMTTRTPLALTIGCSWGWKPADPATLDPYFKKMASQGQTFFAASGDNSTWNSRKYVWPADDAYVVSVGGTDLVTASAGGAWQSETAWVDSGGGISPDGIAIPSWQKLSGVINSSNRGSTTLRNGPDVAANANFTFYTCGNQTTCQANVYGGTSFAAPMWAGYVALANQQAQANGQSPVGFLNPTVYQQNLTPATYAANFHDITSGTSGSYSAVAAYDLVTGWGSPTPNLISALVGTTTPPTSDFSLAASPSSISVAQGAQGSSTISTAIVSGSASTVAFTASNLPSGVSVGFVPSSVTTGSSSTATFTVGSSVTPGTYVITVTGTSSSATHTTTISLTVTATAQSSFSLSDSPSTRTINRGGSTTTSITATPAGGFNSSIALSVSGQTSGLTFSFSPSTISATGSSTLTINSSHGASTGVRTLTITGTGGGQSHTATFTLTINK